MNEHDQRATSASVLAVVTGAAAGALAVYILRTPGGRSLLDTAIGLLDDFALECARFRQAFTRAQTALSEEWQAAQDSETSSTGGGRETVF